MSICSHYNLFSYGIIEWITEDLCFCSFFNSLDGIKFTDNENDNLSHHLNAY